MLTRWELVVKVDWITTFFFTGETYKEVIDEPARELIRMARKITLRKYENSELVREFDITYALKEVEK